MLLSWASHSKALLSQVLEVAEEDEKIRTIIAGSRSITDFEFLKAEIAKSGFKITTILSGGAKGVDWLGELYAKENGIPLEVYIPEWSKHGRSAGIIRNQEMVRAAGSGGGLIALWDGSSAGTKSTVVFARNAGLRVHVAVRTKKMVAKALRKSEERPWPS